MTTKVDFKQEAEFIGTKTEESLAEILGSSPEDLAEELGPRLELIRESEREAERISATIRLY